MTLRHEYEPRGACREIFHCRDEEVLIAGPAGTGKSRACLEKIFALCLQNPNLRALMVRKTARSLGSTALVTWRTHVAKEAIAIGAVKFYGGSATEPPQYKFRNGSTVVLGGLDNPMRVMSSEYDIVYIMEATEVTVEDIEMIKTRLRNWTMSFQQLIMDCNPSTETHFLLQRERDGTLVKLESRHEDNPRLVNLNGEYTEQGKKYLGMLDRLTGVRHKRLRLGLWVSSEGIVYEEFDPAVHVVDWEYDTDGKRIPLSNEWPRYWVVDFGYVEPFVCQFYARDHDGCMWLYREIFQTQRTVTEHAKRILECVTERKEQKLINPLERSVTSREQLEWIEPQPTAIICDHDADNRRTLEQALGMPTVPAIKSIDDGIDHHKELLRTPGALKIMRDCVVDPDIYLREHMKPGSTVEEYASYSWKRDIHGMMTDTPEDANNHGMDAVRYMTEYFHQGSLPRASIVG